jgi:hypothetical protein
MIIVLYTLKLPGSTMAQMVSKRCNFRTCRNRGIMPPEKNIVTMRKIMKTLFPKKSLRERGYALSMLRETLIKVPSMVYTTVFM